MLLSKGGSMGRILRSKRLVLKELHNDYIPDYLDMFSPMVQRILGVPSTALEGAYLAAQLQKQKEGRIHFYCIFYKENEQLIGSIEIRSPEHRGQLYTWLHEDYWHAGFFAEAFKVAVQDYFKYNPQVTTFTARVDISNKRSFKALLKVGCVVAMRSRGPREDQYELVCKAV